MSAVFLSSRFAGRTNVSLAAAAVMLVGGVSSEARAEVAPSAPSTKAPSTAAKGTTTSGANAADVTAKYLRHVKTSVDPIIFARPFDLVIILDRAEGERIELPTTLPENTKVRPAGRPRRERVVSAPGRVNERIMIPMLALDTDDTKTPALVLRGPNGGRIEIPSKKIVVVDPDAAPEDGANAPANGSQPNLAPSRGAAVDGAAPVRQAAAPSQGVERAKRHFLYNVADARPWAVISTLLASLFALFATLFVESRRVFALRPDEEIEDIVAAPARPAHETALERLDALLAAPYLKQGDVETFVQKLMDEVLRLYLEDRFEMPVTTQTTAELGEDLFSIVHPGLDVALVRSLLEDTDLVKFARAEMQRDVAHQMAQKVRQLIVSTAATLAQSSEEEANNG